MRRRDDACGQATSEYVALVALVAVVLALAAGLVSGGVGGELLAGMRRALCQLSAGACARPAATADVLAPCPVERTTSGESLAGAFELVRLGGGATLSAARGSDGRVTVTLASTLDGGGEVALGARLALGGRGRDGSASARMVQEGVSSRSWTLPSAAAARGFVERYGSKATLVGKAVDVVRSGCSILCDALGWRPHAELPPPDERYLGGGAAATVAAALGPVAVDAANGSLLGVRLRRDGSSTWLMQLDAAAGAQLGLGAATAGAGSQRQWVAAYTFDRQRRPVALTLEKAARSEAVASVGGRRGLAAARLGAGDALVTETEATLDLADAPNRAAAAAFAAALREPAAVRRLRDSAAALGRRIAAAGVVDRRTYALSRADAELGVRVALGAQLGGALARTRERMRLLSAETRLPGLPFLPRDDCRATAPPA